MARRSLSNKEMRRPYEFDKKTIVEALRRANWSCESCGVRKEDTPEQYLEAHHRLPIWIVVSYYPQLAAEVIKSIANCSILCCSCHDKLHSKKKVRDYFPIANELIARSSRV